MGDPDSLLPGVVAASLMAAEYLKCGFHDGRNWIFKFSLIKLHLNIGEVTFKCK